ncbi:MAG: serine/threonine protein kinase [Cyanobacteria bacterium REEB67]|nr:serine/threonine protein kinase [Cyanobacteria bacterium REEB67]
MLRDTFNDQQPLANKKHKLIVSAPENYQRLYVALAAVAFPVGFLLIIANSLRSTLDVFGAVMVIGAQFRLLWALGLLMLVSGGIFAFIQRRQHRRLQILDTTNEGISLGRMEDRASEAFDYTITWKEIRSVEEVPTLEHGKTWLFINSALNVTFKLSSDNAFRWLGRDELIDGLIKHAPQAELHMLSGDYGAARRDLTYTSLWLEELDAAGRRKRMRPLDSGDKVGEGVYEIIKQLGAGGQGRAYLAKILDHTLPFASQEVVVLKEYVLPTKTAIADRLVEMQARNYYLSEALILQQLDHPAIMKIFDSFEEDFNGFLVLEYVKGTSMRSHMAVHGVCPEQQAVRIAIELCDILIYMHGSSPPIIHGDVTPENIIVTTNGAVKLIDFTVAHKFLSERKMRVAGKRGYVAPEQYAGQTLPQSDIYALGCTLFFLLSGTECSGEEDDFELNYNANKIPGGPVIRSIVAKCMADDLEDRYESVAKLKKDLLQYAVARPESEPQERTMRPPGSSK